MGSVDAKNIGPHHKFGTHAGGRRSRPHFHKSSERQGDPWNISRIAKRDKEAEAADYHRPPHESAQES
jgi:hypothetical protein